MYVTVMLSVPGGNVVSRVVEVSTVPFPVAICPFALSVPRGVVPAKNARIPVGTEPAPVAMTFAVRVTVVLAPTLVLELVSVVVVGACEMVTFTGAETLEVKLLSP